VYEAALYEQPSIGDLRRITCEAGGAGQRARAVVDAHTNKRYFVQVGGRGNASGMLNVELSCEQPCPPDNDNINGAWPAPYNFTQTTDTRGATVEAGEPLPCGNIGKTVWFRIDGAGEATFTLSTAGSDFSTVIAVYKAAAPSPPGGMTNVQCITGADVAFDLEPGSSYFVQVGGADGAGGVLQTLFQCAAGTCAGRYGQGGGGGIGTPIPGGVVHGPDTGSGGYLKVVSGQR
jgi:hypothetical protein